MAWAHAALGHLEPRDFNILFLIPTSLCCSGPSLSSHFNVPIVLNKHGRASQQQKAGHPSLHYLWRVHQF